MTSAGSQTEHLTGRVPKKQLNQLKRISEEEGIERSTALRKIIEIGIREYRKERAVDQYRRAKISIGKAAELSGVSIFEMYDILQTEKVPFQIDVQTMRENLKTDFGK